MKNLSYCIYTFKHQAALRWTVCRILRHDPDLCRLVLAQVKNHDMDKLVMYQMFDKPDCSAFHKTHSNHHVTNSLPHSEMDYVEAIFDYECSGYTKPDKPRNAYDTVQWQLKNHAITQECYDRMMALIKSMGLDKSYRVRDIDPIGAQYFDQMTVSEDDILNAITEYLKSLK